MAGEPQRNGHDDPASRERLQRVLSSRGVASRRKAEQMIVDGRVKIDGTVVTELGTKVNPHRQKVEVDGKLIPAEQNRYILLNKPGGYITTTSDERGRRTVMELVQVPERVVPVGRLDRPTEGLLLLTSDGNLAHRVMHPSYGIEKEYEVLVDGDPPRRVLDRLSRGITIDGEKTVPAVVRPLHVTDDGTVIRLVLQEGRNRIIRRVFEAVGYPVLKLRRTRIGPLQLGSIPRGSWRDLTPGELTQIREAVGMTDEDVVATLEPRRVDRERGGPTDRDRKHEKARSSSGRPRSEERQTQRQSKQSPQRRRRQSERNE